jgi:hypothetical protein
MVSNHITEDTAERVGFQWAATPQHAFDRALSDMRRSKIDRPTVAVLRDAPRMLPLKTWQYESGAAEERRIEHQRGARV